MAAPSTHTPVRGTQLLVEHMGEVLRRPSLVALEVGWRWSVGIPFLLVLWRQVDQVLAAYPLDSSGFNSIDTQNPWMAVTQLANVWNYYEPPVTAVLRWLLPVAALGWVVASALARNLMLMRLAAIPEHNVQTTDMQTTGMRLPFRPFSMIALQAALLSLLTLTLWGWYRSIEWTAATHISAVGEPDLIGYAIWAIFLTLGFFTAWALMSWVLSVAPLLMLLERRSALSAIGESLKLGKPFSSKLAEINLVMGIVKLALMVLAMVFSAAPLPFSDELGPDAMHFVAAMSAIFYLVANDFFQVVRLRAFLEFWRLFRAP
jgi:hypothetical protein